MSGYFDKTSMAYRALNQRAVSLTYGQRALTIGATHSLLAQGTAQSTSHRETPYTRLALTARLFESVFLGDKAEADRALAFTAKRHATVKGTINEYGGPAHPAGQRYDAYDPDGMWWTVAFTLDSVEHQYDRLVRRMRDRDREDLFDDFVRWGELFGMPRSAAPRDYADFRQQYDAYLASDAPYLTAELKQLGRYIAGYDVPNQPPLPTRPVFSTIHFLTVGGLPPRVRALFDMEWSSLDEVRYQALCASSRVAHGNLPLFARSPIARGRSKEFYKVVAKGEQSVIRRGGVSMPGVSDVHAPEASRVS
ncbi:MAG TPA: oxygenase MpaB family protein [Nocardioidaceae bacterium]|nr:oxygenase MpaB family protein [Nocardioidaceae bacterium]